MSGGVTWADLGLVLLVLASFVGLLLGALFVFGAGMASSPSEETKRYERQGCAMIVVALIVLVAAIVGLWR